MRQNTIGAKQVSELITKAEVLARGSGTFVSRGWTRVILPAVLAATGSAALAGPEGASVVRGDVNITKVGNQTVIQASDRAIINYRSFDIGAAEAVRFIQPGSTSRVLNRIDGAAPTRIDGSLSANGRVYIVNPSGVIFGNGARVNVAGLYAAGGHLSNADFVNGVDRFSDVRGAVENHGSIEAQAAALIGSRVANTGQIVAPNGTVVMASGSDVLIGEQGGNIYVRVSGEAGGGDTKKAAVDNSGSITADRGQVVMGAGDMIGLAIRNTGSVKARNVTVQGQGTGIVMVGGTIDTSNQADSKSGAGTKGGRVEITGENVGLDNATITASGTNAGGTVLIGGDAHGEGDVEHAQKLIGNTGTRITADATENGAGGKVVLWSDQWTAFGGEISARGGATGGDGGFIETSSKRMLTIEGAQVNASAARGNAGLWLLDPTDVTLSTAATASMGGSPNFNPTGNPATGNVQISAIVTALQGGSNVTVTTASVSGAGPEGGSIRINNPVAVDLATPVGDQVVSLTLNADSFIVVDGAVSATGTAGDTFSVIMNSGITGASATKSITVNQAISTVNNGAITLNASGGLIALNAGLNSGTGALNLTGAGITQSAGALTGGALTLAGTGTFNLNSATNAVASIQGTVTGALTLVNNAALTVNLVDSQNNPIDITAQTGLLTVAADIRSGTSTVVLTADDMSLGAAVNIGGNTVGPVSASSVTFRPFTASRNVFLGDTGGAGNLNLSGADLLKIISNSLVIGRTNSTGTTTLSQAAGGLDLAAESFTLTVNSGSITSNQLTTSATSPVTYNIGVAAAGTLNLNQAINANGSAITINGGTAGDTFNIGATAASNAISVNGAGGIDTFNVGATNSVAGLLANVAINGGGNGDAVNYNDGAGAAGTYSISASGILSTNATGAVTLTNLGAGSIALNTGTGNDTIRIGGTADATGNLNDVIAAVTVNGGTGTNAIHLIDASNASARTIDLSSTVLSWGATPSVTYGATVTDIRVFGGSAGDTMNLNSSAASTAYSLNGNAGNDNFTVTQNAVTNTTTINGGANNNTLTLGGTGQTLDNILGAITFNGGTGGGTNTLTIDDTLDATGNTYTVTGTTIARAGAGTTTYDASVTAINVTAGAGIDTFNAQATASTVTQTTLTGNAGLDTFNIGNASSVAGILGNVSVNGGGNADVLNYNDSAQAGATYTVNASGIQRATGAFTAFANMGAGTVTLNAGNSGGTGANIINIANLASGPAFVANGGGGNDTFRIGGTADANGNLTNIIGSITINGSTGTNDVRIDDGASAVNRTYTISGATTSFGTGSTISHDSSIQQYSLFAGSNGNTINVTDTIAARTFFRINGGAGAETVNVGSAGNDLAGFLGVLEVQAAGGANALNINDQANAGGFTYTVTGSGSSGSFTRTGVSTVTFDANTGTVGINTAAAANTVNVTGTISGAAVTITGGAAADTFNVGSVGSVSVLGSNLTLNGAGGSDILNYNDASNAVASTYVVTSNAITRGGAGNVNHATIEAVNLNGGSSGNTYNVNSTAGTVVTTLTGGVGNDVFNIGGTTNTLGGVAGAVTVTAAGGADTLNINDTANATGTTYGVTSTTVTRSGAGTTTFDGTTETLNVNAGSGANTVTVGTSGTLDGLTAALTVNGGTNTALTINDSTDTTSNTYTISTTNIARSGGPTIAYTSINALNVTGGTGNDTFNTTGGLTGTLNGGTGTNTLNFDDSASSANNTYTFTSTSIARGGTITYSNFGTVGAQLGSGTNAAFIQSASAAITITGGTGNDNFFVDSNSGTAGGTVDNITALLTLNGGTGTNNLFLSDFDDTGATPDTVTLTATTVGAGGADTFFGTGGSVTFSNISAMTIFAGSNLTVANGAVLGANTTIDTRASTDRTLTTGTVDGARSLTVNTGTANASYGILGGTTPLTGFSSTSNLNILSGNITTATSGTGITLSGASRLDNNITLDSGGAALSAAAINSNNPLTEGLTIVAGGGDVTLGGIGLGSNLGAFQITSANNVNVGGITATRITQLAGTGTTTFSGTLTTTTVQGVQLAGNAFSIGAGADTFSTGTFDGVFTVNATGTTTIFGGNLNLGGAFTKSGAGNTDLSANITSAGGAIAFAGGNVTLNSASTLNTTGSANPISFANAVNLNGNDFTLISDQTSTRFGGGANSVTGTGAGVLTFRPNATGTTISVATSGGSMQVTSADLDALANDATSRIDIGIASTGAHIMAVGASTFRDPVRFLSPAGGQVNFNGNVTGSNGASITAIASSGIGLSGDIVTSGSAITLTGPVTVVGNRLLDTTNAGAVATGANIAVSGAIESSLLLTDSLTLQAGSTGDVSTTTVGLATPLLAFNIGSSNNSTTGSIAAQGITVNAANGSHGLLSASSGGINLFGGIFSLTAGATTSAGGEMQVQNTGLLTIGGNIILDGRFRQGTAVTPGAVSLNGDITTTGDDVTLAGATTLVGATRAITTAGGTVLLSNTVTGPSAFTISAGAGNVTLSGATAVDGGFTSSGAAFNNTGGTITTVNQAIGINHTGAVTIGGGLNAGTAAITTAGSQITQNASIIGSTYNATAVGDLTVNADITSSTGNIDLHSGTGGTGNITFGTGPVNLFANTISLRAGDGAGGGGAGSQVIATGATVFNGTTPGTSPVNLTIRSDGNISDSTTPAATSGTSQYANGPAGVNLTLISDEGSVNVSDGARVAGTNLALTAASGITIGAALAPNTLTLNSATTLGGDIITTGDLRISAALGLSGGARELRSDSGVLFIDAPISAAANNLTLTAREIQVNAAVGGTGALFIQPRTASANIVLGSLADNATAIADGVLDLSVAEITNLSNGFSNITIGRADGSGAITTAAALTFLDPVTVRTPTGSIVIGHALTGLDNGGFRLESPATDLGANITTATGAVFIANGARLINTVAIDTTGGGSTLLAGNVTIDGATNADATGNDRSLIINAGTINLNGAVGSAAGTRLHDLTLTSASNTLTGAVTTSGAQSYTGATTAQGTFITDTTGSSAGTPATIRFNNDLNVTGTTLIHSQGGLADTIFVLAGISSVGSPQSITINSGSANTIACGPIGGADVLFSSALLLCGDTTVTASTSSIFNSTIDSQTGPSSFFLTVNSPLTTFNGNIGTANILSALTTDAAGTLTINAGIINTVGQQTFNDAVVLGTDLVATSNVAGVSFNNGVNAASHAITLNGPGTGALIGGVTNATTITTDAGGSTQVSGTVAASGAVTFNDALQLTDDTTVNGSAITIFGADSSSSTPRSLAATTSGAFSLGASGQTNALGSVSVTANTLSLASVRSTNAQTYTGATTTNGVLRSTTSGPVQINGNLTLAGDTTLQTAGAASSDDVIVSGTIQSPGTPLNLTLTAGAGDVILSSDVGGSGNPLASVTAQANTISLRNVTTTGNQVFTGETGLIGNLFSTGTGSIAVGGNLTLGSDSTVSTNNGSIVFGRAVNSDSIARNLVVNTGGGGLTRFVGSVGNNNRLQTITTNGDGTTRFEGSQVRTVGAQNFNDAITLGNNLLFEGSSLRFGSTIDSDGLATARTLTANTSGSGATTFVGSVGSTVALAAITTNADGSTTFQNGAKTTGSLTFNDPTSLTGTFDAGGFAFFANTATLSGSLNANGGLTFTGAADLSGTVNSGTSILFSNTATLSGSLAANTGMTFTGAVLINGNTTIDARGSTLFFRSTIDTATTATDPLLSLFSAAVANADVTPIRFNGSIGVTKRLGGLVLGPDLTATPLAATIGFTNGAYNAGGQIQASGVNLANLLRIVTGPQGFRMGNRQKLTAFGRLQIETTGQARLSDLTSLASINVQANSIVVALRPGGSLLDNKFETPIDTLDADGGVDFVARDTIDFSVVPTTTGSGFQPSFATDSGTPGLNTGGFVNRQFTNGVATRLFTDPRTAGTTLLALDLKGLGPSIANTATSLAGAIPRDSETREIATPVTVSEAVERVLKEMGIEINRLGMQDLVAFLVGRSLYQDQPLKAKPSAERGDYRVTINRLTQSTAEAVVAAYNELAFETTTNDKGEQVRTKRTEAIAEDMGDAWDRYSETVDEPTGAGFRTWLETLGEKAPERDRGVLQDLNRARTVLQRLDYLGLSPFEASIPKRQLLGDIKPNGMTSRQIEEAVLGTAPVASAE